MELVSRWGGRIVGWGALAVVAVFVAAKIADRDGSDLPLALLTLWPWVGFGAAVAGALAALLGARRLAAALTVAALTCAAVLVPRAVGSTAPPQGDDRLVVMTLNMRFGKADVAQVARLVEEHDVDVLVGQEVTPGTLTNAEGTNLDQLLPHREGRVPTLEEHMTTGAYAAVVWSREPMTLAEPVEGMPRYSPRVIARTDLGPVVVADVHTTSPLGGREMQWRADLDAVARGCRWSDPRIEPGPTATVVAGDLNGSVDHPSLRAALTRCGLTDAADAVGHGLDATYAGSPANPIAVARTSYVLTDLAVVDTRTARVGGTEHRAVIATLARR